MLYLYHKAEEPRENIMKISEKVVARLVAEAVEEVFGNMAKCQKCPLMKVDNIDLWFALTDAREAEYYARNAERVRNYGYDPKEVKCESVGGYGKYFVLKCTSLISGKQWVAFYSPVKDEIREETDISWLETWGE